MDARTHRGPVEPPFGCSGLHLVKSDVDAVVRNLGIPEAPDRRPRYFAEGVFVVVTYTRRRLSITAAWDEAVAILGRSVDPTIGDLADAYRDELSDLISAMREAMGNRPTPPAAVARAA